MSAAETILGILKDLDLYVKPSAAGGLAVSGPDAKAKLTPELLAAMREFREEIARGLGVELTELPPEPKAEPVPVDNLELLYPDGTVTRAEDSKQPDGYATHFRTSKERGWEPIPPTPEEWR